MTRANSNKIKHNAETNAAYTIIWPNSMYCMQFLVLTYLFQCKYIAYTLIVFCTKVRMSIYFSVLVN